MLELFFQNLVERSSNLANILFGGSYGWVKLAFFSVFASFFFAFPSYDVMLKGDSDYNWASVVERAREPFTKKNYPPRSHQEKTELRLTGPIIGNLLGLERPGFLALQIIFLVVFFLVLTKILWQLSSDVPSMTFLSLAFGTIFVGNVLVSDIRGFFDVIAFTFLILAMCWKSPAIIFVATFLASFTDERGFLATSLVFLYWIVKEHDVTSLNIRSLVRGNWYSWAVVLSGIMYLGARFVLFKLLGLSTPSSDGGLWLAIDQINAWAFGLWTGLEGVWLIVIAAAIILFISKRYSFLTALIAFSGGIIVVAVSVIDITRSMAYVFPIALISVVIVEKTEKHLSRYLYFAAMLISFLPSYYVSSENNIMMSYPFLLQMLRLLRTSLIG